MTWQPMLDHETRQALIDLAIKNSMSLIVQDNPGEPRGFLFLLETETSVIHYPAGYDGSQFHVRVLGSELTAGTALNAANLLLLEHEQNIKEGKCS